MRRFRGILLASLLAVSLAAPAAADVIWEPEDSFYQKHAEECQLLQRSFYANGPEALLHGKRTSLLQW